MSRALALALLAILAASHGVNDLLAGWLLGGQMPEATAWDRLPWLAIYAALAFAGQIPAAWIIDRSGRPAVWLGISLGLMVVAVALSFFSPGTAVLVSGVASAFVHVAGGALALQLPRGPEALGWFSAPGILGLTLGGWLGYAQGAVALWAILLPAGLLASVVALRRHWPAPAVDKERPGQAPSLEAHDGLMLLLLLALTLRSAVWDLVQVAEYADPEALLALAFSAAGGKVLGGWMSARRPTLGPICVVLVTACALLEWSRERLAGLCVGIALLQSAIPASIVLLHRSFGTTAARATAYGLGLTVALGGLVFLTQITLPVAALVLAGVSVAMLWRGLGRRRLRTAAGS